MPMQYTTECQSEPVTMSDEYCQQLEQTINDFHKYMSTHESLPGIIFVFGT